ncbi:MAG: DUF3344 domain-containing protein, partial [Chloroflexi bacterium]|nr:DUF3344 domain-containing protein [Chloroflexota bacterium]
MNKFRVVVSVIVGLLLLGTLLPAAADGPLTNRWGPNTGTYGIVAAGVGLEASPSGTITLDIPGTPVQAFLYWAGYDTDNPGDGDNQVQLARDANPAVPITADATFGPDYWVDGIQHHYVYVADVTAQVAAGSHTYTVSDFVLVHPNATRYGAGLLVVYDDPALPQTSVEIRDGLDAMYWNFLAPRGPNSEVACLQFAADTQARQMDYAIIGSGIDPATVRPNVLWALVGSGALPTPNIAVGQGLWTWDPVNAFEINVNGELYPFYDSDGDEWDTLTSDETDVGALPIPAGAEWACFQAESDNSQNPPLSGASLVVIA